MGVDMSIPARSRALADLIGSWGLERPAIAGHDIGGAIVLRTHLYRTMPNHVFEQAVIAHLRTATAGLMDEMKFEVAFGQWSGKDGQAHYLRNLGQFDERHTAEFEPLLASMRTPVRFIWGEDDDWFDPAFARRLQDLLLRSDLVLIPGLGGSR